MYCLKDYSDIFVYECAKCKKKITQNSVSTNTDVYHIACFSCEHCGKELENVPYVETEGKLYCVNHVPTGKECFHCSQEILGVEIISTKPNDVVGQVSYHTKVSEFSRFKRSNVCLG